MTSNKSRGHGRSVYYIVGEGYAVDDIRLPGRPAGAGPEAMGAPAARAARTANPAGYGPDEPPPPDAAFRFGRMFKDLPKFDGAPPEGLVALGQAMTANVASVTDHPNLPAGYTYLGQFIDHDITLDQITAIPGPTSDPDTVENRRTPSLDLDSIYGLGPDLSPAIYEPDKLHLKLGRTTPSPFGNADVATDNDLLRGLDPSAPTKAATPDPRNDENLAVAQTHLAFMKFHNRVVDTLGLDFAAARRTVCQHYQAMVWFDFVPRLVDPLVWLDVHLNGRRFLDATAEASTLPSYMPVEFSVAAYRLGHSMIRSVYEWNRVFSTGNPFGAPTGEFKFLFQFTGNVPAPGSGFQGPFTGGAPTLPTNWVADWTRLVDFSAKPAIGNPDGMNRTRRIDTRLVDPLRLLPEFAALPQEQQALMSLAVRNLLRGRVVGLPTGQDVAKAMGVTPLSPDVIRAVPHEAALVAHDFHNRTPLWYYVLREAEVQQDGLRLGTVGSRIVVETFHRLILASDDSIFLTPGWTAHPGLRPTNPKAYSFPDLLDVAFDGQVNPLGRNP